MSEIPEKIMQRFCELAGELSPENLYCDGEISHRQAQVKYKKLMREWLSLEKQVGRSVSEQEVWDYEIERLERKRVEARI